MPHCRVNLRRELRCKGIIDLPVSRTAYVLCFLIEICVVDAESRPILSFSQLIKEYIC